VSPAETTKPGAEWDAGAYHALSNPQFEWGLAVLGTLDLRGDERAIDAGCGSGRLTAELLLRLPRGRVVALDRSRNMVEEARRHLAPRFADRVSFLCADLLEFSVEEPADLIFSTATFHWVLDQAELYRRLFAALAPGGRLVAQYGGAPNLAAVRGRADEILAEPPFAPFFEGFRKVWVYIDASTAAAHMRDAGFTDIEARVTPAPTCLPDEATYRAFLRSIVFRAHLERLPADLAEPFIDRMAVMARQDPRPYELDYHRLNVRAQRPAARPARRPG
jgi:trans-aconitate 2-methyltransferase